MLDQTLLLQRATLLLEQGRTADAEKTVRQALEQEPEDSEALALLTRCYFAKREFERGIETALQATAADPGNSFNFYLLAFGYYQKENGAAAIKNLQQAIELNPYTAEYFGLQAYVLIAEKRFAGALEKADEGLAIEAENLTCLNARSIALNKMNRTADAIETMQGALAQDPGNEITHATVGWNFIEKGKHKEAQHHFLEALRLNPDYSSAKAGLKEALKSKLALYRWLLQYSFWVQNRGRKLQIALPIILYIVFRVLIALSQNSDSTAGLSLILVGIYILIVVTSWTINSIANFVLLFHPLGRHALSVSERWSAITVVAALVTGLLLITFSLTHIADGTAYDGPLFFAGLVCVSLALPLGQIEYPLSFKKERWHVRFSKLLSAFGVLSLLIFVALPVQALVLFSIYAIAFLIYNWSGLAR
jgi:tetratricopeptide (TPR) repeat protein